MIYQAYKTAVTRKGVIMTETHTPLSNAETAAFCSQIAMILRSGISSIEGISIMLEDTTEPEEKRLLESINISGLYDPDGTDWGTGRKTG